MLVWWYHWYDESGNLQHTKFVISEIASGGITSGDCLSGLTERQIAVKFLKETVNRPVDLVGDGQLLLGRCSCRMQFSSSIAIGMWVWDGVFNIAFDAVTRFSITIDLFMN